MGYYIAWAAVRGKSAEVLRSQLRLRSIGTVPADEPWPDVRDYNGSVLGVPLKDGWYLLLADHEDRWIERLLDGSVLARVSRNAEAVTCLLYEGILASQASGWKNGRERWFVSYDGSNGLGQFELWGEVPPEFTALREKYERQQQESTESKVDHLFEAAVELAQGLVGFSHDETQYLPGLADVTCEVLAEEPRWPFWSRLLGRVGG